MAFGSPVTCEDCEHALFGPSGIYCRVFMQDIWDETIARQCQAFDALAGGARDRHPSKPKNVRSRHLRLLPGGLRPC
jgi:hypothetical protein